MFKIPYTLPEIPLSLSNSANDGCLYVFDREQNKRTLKVWFTCCEVIEEYKTCTRDKILIKKFRVLKSDKSPIISKLKIKKASNFFF